MDVAAAVLRAEHPGFEPPSSVRSTGVRPWARAADDVVKAVAEEAVAATPEEGRLAVIAPCGCTRRSPPCCRTSWRAASPTSPSTSVLLDPRQAKGLEFDRVLVVEPGEYGVSDLYVALTRATQTLGVVHGGELPESLRGVLEPVPSSPPAA